MDLLLAILQCACFLATAAALAFGRFGKQVQVLVGLTALLGLVSGLAAPGPRTLEWTHTFAGYFGIDIEPSAVAFPTGATTQPGWLWPLPFVGFAVFAVFALRRVRADRPAGEGLVVPMEIGRAHV